MNPTLGTFISALRKEKGLTQRELSEMLSVSDKTVSHWERDETSPDISLLPVIAEIFGITVDELLKGEKKEELKSPSDEKEDKNTGILYALDIAFNRFRTKSYISIALSVIAVLCGSIISYFKAVDVGYPSFIAMLIVPIMLTAVFRGGFNSSLLSPYADKEILKVYAKKANRITVCNLYFSLLCFVLYSARVILYYADIPLLLIIFLATGTLVYLCERILRRKDLVSHSDESITIQKKTLLKIFCCFICAAMMLTVLSNHTSLDEEEMVREKAEYTLISEEDFVSLMEKDVPAPDETYGREDGRWDLYTELYPGNKGEIFTFNINYGHYDHTLIDVLDPDADGEITFTYNNLEIGRYSYVAEEGFRVYTHAQLLKARAEAEREYGILFIIHLILYPVAVLISVGFYFILKRFFLSKAERKTLSLRIF